MYRMTMMDENGETVLKIGLPGKSKDDVKLSVSGNELMLNVGKKRYFLCDVNVGDKVEAEMKDGLLKIKVKKDEREILIK